MMLPAAMSKHRVRQPRLTPDLNNPILRGKLPLAKLGEQLGKRLRTMQNWVAQGMPVFYVGKDPWADPIEVGHWLAGRGASRRSRSRRHAAAVRRPLRPTGGAS
jgi:hypothetical protein